MTPSPNFELSISFVCQKDCLQKAEVYWRSQGFSTLLSSDRLSGRRGSILGNLVSFNMRKLISKLEVEQKGPEVFCKVYVYSAYQTITEWNITSFQIEMLKFQASLENSTINIPDDEFHRGYKKSIGRWLFSFGIAGHKLTDDYKALLRNSLNGAQLPVYKILEDNDGIFSEEKRKTIGVALCLILVPVLLILVAIKFRT